MDQFPPNYVLLQQPSGHYELVSSTNALNALPPSSSVQELSGLESVYKIKEEDFYLDPTTTTATPPIIPTMTPMDPMVQDIFALNRNLEYIQPPMNTAPMAAETVQLQLQMQLQPPIPTPTQQQYYVEPEGTSSTVTTTPAVAPAGIQLSGAVMSIVSSLVSPGATAFQMDNNLIICNPSGQIIQISLDQQQHVYTYQEGQEAVEVVAVQQQIQQEVLKPNPQIQPSTSSREYTIVSNSNCISATVNPSPTTPPEPVFAIKTKVPELLKIVEVGVEEQEEMEVEEEKTEDVSDDFELKIVSCVSISPEKKEVKDEDCESPATPPPPPLLPTPPPPLPKLEPYIDPVKPANIPPWLSQGVVDDDDELLIAFKNRVDTNKTEICQLCYSWFDGPSELRSHIAKDHRRTRLTQCTICGARYSSRIQRLRHEKLHKYDLKYRASVYLRLPLLRSHFRRRYRPARFSPWYTAHVDRICDSTAKLPFPCFSCNLSFCSSDDVAEHYNNFHAIQTCGLCGETFPRRASLIQHEQEGHGLYHIRNNYEGGAWALWEKGCEETEEKDVILSNIAFFHDYGTTGSSDRNFDEEFVSEAEEKEEEPMEELNESFEDEDGGTPNGGRARLAFPCTECPKSYDNEHDLRRHARCHTSPNKAQLACQYCGRVFKTHSHKKEHERTHTGEKPYVCPICTRSFIQSSNLKKHITTHQQSSLQCGTCGKQFIKEASLILHQRAHAQDRKFRCQICDRAYNYASLLKRHMRIHTGEMPYSCESCGMLFHELVSLHYHRKKVHTGERPHKCETCGRAFILSSDLKKHIQIHLKLPQEKGSSGNGGGFSGAGALRKRSQSKSIEINPLSPLISCAVSIQEGQGEEGEEQEEESPTPPSPLSSSDAHIEMSKSPVVRYYGGKNYINNRGGAGKGGAGAVNNAEDNTNHHHLIVSQSSYEDAEMLLAMREYGSNNPQYVEEIIDPSSYDTRAYGQQGAVLQKNIDDMLQLSGIDFDMNNIIVVPDGGTEIEIVENNR